MYFLVSADGNWIKKAKGINIDGKRIKKAKWVNKYLVKSIRHRQFVDIWFNEKKWDKTRKEFKVSCIKLDLRMLEKFLCLLLMIKDTH